SNSFRSLNTLVSIFNASYYIGFLAIGVTFVIITGGIDLLICTVMMCSSIIGGVLYKEVGLPMWLVLISIVAVGALFGLVNGIMVSRFKLPPFIATLGTMMVARGLGSIVSNVQSVTFPLRGTDDGFYKNFFRLSNNFPVGIFVLIFVAILAAVILNRTKVGRYIFAIGSNREATRLSGVNVVRWETIAYVISGICAGIGGVAYGAT